VLLEKRNRPSRPPVFTLDLSSENIERCQEIYRKAALRRYPIEDGKPYFVIIFPKDFRPVAAQATDREGKHPGAVDAIPRGKYDDISNDE
jgi:hypothetical protein